MRSDNDKAQIFGGTLGPPGAFLGKLFDAGSGQYFSLVSRDRAIASLHAQGLTGKGVTAAIVDTGLWSEHPEIRRATIARTDVIGEGLDDLNGHGTEVALILLAVAPAATLYSAKALDRNGEGNRDTLIAGLRWSFGTGAKMINLSAGVYDEECAGDCPLCTMAAEAKERKIPLLAAAGNRRGVTACPAKYAVTHLGEGLAVGAFDVERGVRAANSGIATLLGDVGPYDLKPVENSEPQGG